jgi:hypothetical protein
MKLTYANTSVIICVPIVVRVPFCIVLGPSSDRAQTQNRKLNEEEEWKGEDALASSWFRRTRVEVVHGTQHREVQ